ncbi:tripartite tricarboxylate transporter TctB family protein [Bacillus taeanensis]|uniref:Tripartite tricarboxylate transporter TctB family protein n=1 Tax=Bacillus taeanensis TaxID=273032 RepID=A0A366XV60_9BACI|nr:tripartite tricarboxylate transporter TctB family protein [Bacillus taeanensis]RBW68033.1 tripartite tricarboxylate transporter TctB family protein [Bacillus taeanensis]
MVNNTQKKISVVLMALALGYLLLSFQLPAFPYAIVDSDVLPKGLGFLLLILSILLFIEKKTTNQQDKPALDKKEIKILLITLGLILAYIVLLEPIGFVLDTMVFLIVTTRILGYQNWKITISVSVIFTLVLYISFNYLLNIYLPQGILPF